MSLLQESSQNRRKVALYGGAFDPFTIAHETITKTVHEHTGWEVWVMPCWGHTFGKQPTSAEHRWNMLMLLTLEYPEWFIPFNWEVANQHAGSMFETLIALHAMYPDIDFHVVIGTDNALNIHKWDRGHLLIKETPFIVIGRGGYEVKDGWFFNPPHLYLEVNIHLSSTQVREAVAAGRHEWAAKNVPATVWGYITEHRLYGCR